MDSQIKNLNQKDNKIVFDPYKIVNEGPGSLEHFFKPKTPDAHERIDTKALAEIKPLPKKPDFSQGRSYIFDFHEPVQKEKELPVIKASELLGVFDIASLDDLIELDTGDALENRFRDELVDFLNEKTLSFTKDAYIDLSKRGMDLLKIAMRSLYASRVLHLMQEYDDKEVDLSNQKTQDGKTLPGIMLSLIMESKENISLLKPKIKKNLDRILVSLFRLRFFLNKSSLKQRLKDLRDNSVKEHLEANSGVKKEFRQFWQKLKANLSISEKDTLIRRFAATGLGYFVSNKFRDGRQNQSTQNASEIIDSNFYKEEKEQAEPVPAFVKL